MALSSTKALNTLYQHNGLDQLKWVEQTHDLPKEPGVYALKLILKRAKYITVVALGSIYFSSGTYLYIGSAKGRGGLAARVGRHFNDNANKKKHWHIDYVRSEMALTGCYFIPCRPSKEVLSDGHLQAEVGECQLAQIFIDAGYRPYHNIGSSDCQCRSHLLKQS